jgi:hypothetical protein
MTDTEFEQFEGYCEERGIRPLGQMMEDLKKIPFGKAKELMNTLAREAHADFAEILKLELA